MTKTKSLIHITLSIWLYPLTQIICYNAIIPHPYYMQLSIRHRLIKYHVVEKVDMVENKFLHECIGRFWWILSVSNDKVCWHHARKFFVDVMKGSSFSLVSIQNWRRHCLNYKACVMAGSKKVLICAIVLKMISIIDSKKNLFQLCSNKKYVQFNSSG